MGKYPSRLDEVLPEGIIYACPICGAEVLFNCWHEDTDSITSVQMPVEDAAKLREESGYYTPMTFVCTGCGVEKEFHPGSMIGNGAICKECVESTNLPKIGNYQIPFDPFTGDQLNYYDIVREKVIKEGQDWPVYSGKTSKPEMKDNYVFVDTLTLDRQERGRSAAHFILFGEDDKTYYMFISDIVKTIKTRGFSPGGTVHGRWSFSKKGQNYGIIPV